MANWATGTLKLRGTRETILKFCREQMNERAGGKRSQEFDYRVEWRIDKDDSEVLIATVHGEPSLSIWMHDSRRNFVEMDTRVPYYWDMDTSDDGDTHETIFDFYECPGEDSWVVVFPFMAAWGVDTDYYEKLSEKYDIEFRIYVVEQGMGYFSEFKSKNGKTTVLTDGPSLEKEGKESGRYGCFIWECPFPFLGG